MNETRTITTILTVDARDLAAKAAAVAADIDKVGASLLKLAGAPAAVEQTLSNSAKATRRQASELENLLRQIDPVYAAHAKLAGEQERVQRALQGLDVQYRSGARSAEGAASAANLLTEKSKALVSIQNELSRGLITGAEASRRIAEAMASQASAAEMAAKAQAAAAASLDQVRRQYDPVYAAIRQHGEELSRVDGILKASNVSEAERARILGAVTAAYDPATRSAHERAAALQKEREAQAALMAGYREQAALASSSMRGQATWNAYAGVQSGPSVSAAASASVFQEAQQEADAVRRAAIARTLRRDAIEAETRALEQQMRIDAAAMIRQEAAAVQALVDRLSPAEVAARKLAESQSLLDKALAGQVQGIRLTAEQHAVLSKALIDSANAHQHNAHAAHMAEMGMTTLKANLVNAAQLFVVTGGSIATLAGPLTDAAQGMAMMDKEGRGAIIRTAAMVAPIAAVTAVLIGGVVAWAHYTSSMREIEQAARLMGGSLGITAGQADALARSAADAGNVSVTMARGMIAEYNRLGKIGPDTIQSLISITRDYAELTGQDAAEATKELGKLLRDPAKGAAELADRFNLLSGRELDHIQRLAEMGKRTEAQATLTDALSDRIKGAADNTSYWSRKWNDLKTGASDALDAVGAKLDRIEKGPARSERIANLQDQLRALQAGQQPGDNDAARRIRDAELHNRGITPPSAAADQMAVAGQLYEEVANSAAEAWKALGDEVAAANRDASRAAEEVVRSYNPMGEQVRKLTEDAAKLAKGIGPDMSDAARQAAAAIQSSIASAQSFYQVAEGMGLTGDTLKQTQRLAFERQTVGMTPNARARYMAERGAQVDNLGSTAPDPDQVQRVTNAIEQIRIAQAQAAADAVRNMGLQVDAADRLAEAAGRGEAAQRRANIENQVAAATLNELGFETRMYLEMVEAATVQQIRAEATSGLQDQIRLQGELTAAYAKGPAAVQAVQIAEQARTLALKEAVEGTAEFSEAYAHYLGLLEKGAAAERGARVADLKSQNADALKLAQAELSLTGKSVEERARILGHLKTEMDLRRQFPGIAEDELQALVAQSDQLLVINQQVQRQQAAWDEITGMLERAFDRLGDALVDAFVSGKREAVDWGSITRGIIASIISDLIRMAAIRPLQNAMFGTNQPTLWDAVGGTGQGGAQGGSMGATQMAQAGQQLYSIGTGTNALGNAAYQFAMSSYGTGLGLSAAGSGMAITGGASGMVSGSGAAAGMSANAAGVMGVTQSSNVVGLTSAGSSTVSGLGAIGAAAPYGFLGGMGGAYLANNFMNGSRVGAGLSGAALGVGSMAAGTAAMGAMGMGAAATAAGASGAMGASAALMAIPVWGWIAAAVIAAVTAIMGASGKPSTMHAGAWVDTAIGGAVSAEAAGGKDGTDVNGMKSAARGVSEAVNTLIQASGLTQSSNLWVGIENSRNNGPMTKIGGWDGQVVSRSTDSEQIVIDTVRALLNRTESKAGAPMLDGDPLVEKAIRNSKAVKVDEFSKDILAARTLSDINKYTAEGYNPFDETIRSMIEQAKETGKQWAEQYSDLYKRVKALDLDAADSAGAKLRAMFEAELGLVTKSFEPLRGLAAVTKQAEINVEAFRPVLETLGYTAAEQADLIQRYTDKMKQNYLDQVAFIQTQGRNTLLRSLDPNGWLGSSAEMVGAGFFKPTESTPELFGAYNQVYEHARSGTLSKSEVMDAFNLASQLRADEKINDQQFNAYIGLLTGIWDRFSQKVQEDSDRATQAAAEISNIQADIFRERLQQLQQESQQLQQIISREGQWRKSVLLGDMSPLSPQQKLTEGLSQYGDLLTKARAGDMTAADQLGGVRESVLKIARDYYASSQGYVDIFNQMMSDSDGLQTTAQKHFSEAQKQTALLQKQLDQMTGANQNRPAIDKLLPSVQEIINNKDLYSAGVDNLGRSLADMQGSTGLTRGQYQAIYRTAGFAGDFGLGGGAAWETDAANKLRVQTLLSYGLGLLPKFADGGDHYGGVRLVGERGPELELTGPARYWSAEDTTRMLSAANDRWASPNVVEYRRPAASVAPDGGWREVVAEIRAYRSEQAERDKAGLYEANQSRAELMRLRRENAALRNQLADRNAAQPKTGTYR